MCRKSIHLHSHHETHLDENQREAEKKTTVKIHCNLSLHVRPRQKGKGEKEETETMERLKKEERNMHRVQIVGQKKQRMLRKKEVRVKETEEATEDQTLRFYLFNSGYSVSMQSLKVTS